jgi:hypothetical protein
MENSGFALAEPSAKHKVSLMKAGYGQCRFIVSEAVALRAICCGAPAPAGSSWCAWHKSVVYVRPNARGPAAFPSR